MPLISLVDPDLGQEETVLRILQAKESFNKIADDIFSKLNSRIADISNNLDTNIQRFEKLKNKISTLDKLETAVILKAPSKFPDVDYVPSKRILPFIPGVVAHPFADNEPPFEPKNSLGGAVDVKNELEQRKQFFATSQLMILTEEQQKERKIPSDAFSIADLFFVDSEQAAYDKVGGSFVHHSSKSKSMTSRQDKKVLKDNLDRTAISDKKKLDDSDIFSFRPMSADVPDLELPDFLPDLPGVALDVVLTDLQGTSNRVFQEFEQKVTLPDIEISTDNTLSAPVAPVVPLVAPEAPKAPPVLPSSSSIPVVSPPPPPPPPPPSLMTPPALPPPPPPSLKTPMTSPTETGGRSDLMAAIRAAGGVGKVKLKSTNNTGLKTRQAEEKQSLRESSALSSNTGGGDLMSSLTKALEARRKAMTGINTTDRQPKPASITGVMSRISDMIPPPEKHGNHSDSGGEEEWT